MNIPLVSECQKLEIFTFQISLLQNMVLSVAIILVNVAG